VGFLLVVGKERPRVTPGPFDVEFLILSLGRGPKAI